MKGALQKLLGAVMQHLLLIVYAKGTSRARMFTFLFGAARELEKLAARASHSLRGRQEGKRI